MWALELRGFSSELMLLAVCTWKNFQGFSENLSMMPVYRLGLLRYACLVNFHLIPILILLSCFILSAHRPFPIQIYLPIEIDFASHSRTFFVVVYCLVSFAIQTSGILIISTCLFFNSMFEFLGNEFHILRISFKYEHFERFRHYSWWKSCFGVSV